MPAPGWGVRRRKEEDSFVDRTEPNQHDVGRRFGRNGEPGLCLIRCCQFPVVPEDHRRRVARFQRDAVYVLNLSEAVGNERMPQRVRLPFNFRFSTLPEAES